MFHGLITSCLEIALILSFGQFVTWDYFDSEDHVSIFLVKSLCGHGFTPKNKQGTVQLDKGVKGQLYNRPPENSPVVLKLPGIPVHTRNGQEMVVPPVVLVCTSLLVMLLATCAYYLLFVYLF